MNFFVKAKDLGGAEHTILCDNAKCALEIEEDKKATGCDVWVEDANGKRIDDAGLSDTAERESRRIGAPGRDRGSGAAVVPAMARQRAFAAGLKLSGNTRY
jgi:hypothetical protein